jgi:NAD-dependent DNA ligase
MPELPDVELFKKEAEKAKEQKIENMDIVDKHFVLTGSLEKYTRSEAKKKIESMEAGLPRVLVRIPII